MAVKSGGQSPGVDGTADVRAIRTRDQVHVIIEKRQLGADALGAGGLNPGGRRADQSLECTA